MVPVRMKACMPGYVMDDTITWNFGNIRNIRIHSDLQFHPRNES